MLLSYKFKHFIYAIVYTFTIITSKLNKAKVENAYSFQKPMEHVQNDLLGNTLTYTKIEKFPKVLPK